MSLPDDETLAAAGLQVSHTDAVLTVTLDKPDERNSQTPRMWHALAAIGDGPARRGARGRRAGEPVSASPPGSTSSLLSPEGVDGEESVPS